MLRGSERVMSSRISSFLFNLHQGDSARDYSYAYAFALPSSLFLPSCDSRHRLNYMDPSMGLANCHGTAQKDTATLVEREDMRQNVTCGMKIKK